MSANAQDRRASLEEATLPPEASAEVVALISGLTHEGRNILQRGQASLERLHWRLRDRGEALDLLARVQRALDDLARLFESARTYATPVVLNRASCDLAVVWRGAWERVTAAWPRPDARLSEDTGGVDLCMEADAARLGLAFQHILHSALAACPDPARIQIACRQVALAGRPAIEVAVRDNGPPVGAEQLPEFFAPFAASGARRSGLGLALARRLVEAHGGQVVAGSAPGGEVLLTLPRRTP
jgi:signal transduction histidine kinase